MGIRKYKPTTPGRRGASGADFSEITRTEPEKSLVRPLHSNGGRNVHGRVTTRHQGGGHKRAYRLIDFRRDDKDGVPAKVAHIEYDPNRTARIALLHYADGEKRYILAPEGLRQGDRVENGPGADIKPGNCLPLRNIPTGTVVHAIELRPGGGAKIARSAGSGVQLLAKEGRLRPAAHAVGRDPARRRRAAAPRSARSATPSRATSSSARRAAAAGRAAAHRPRRGHEPGRPPAGRRRGQDLRRPAPGQPVGPARGPHPQGAQAQRPADLASARQEEAVGAPDDAS